MKAIFRSIVVERCTFHLIKGHFIASTNARQAMQRELTTRKPRSSEREAPEWPKLLNRMRQAAFAEHAGGKPSVHHQAASLPQSPGGFEPATY